MFRITSSIKYPRVVAMTDEVIRSWLHRFTYDPDYRHMDGTKAVPMTCLCEYAGVSRAVVYRFLWGVRPLSAGYRERLTVAINAVSSGLRWFRLGDHSYVMNDPERFQKMPRYERVRRSA